MNDWALLTVLSLSVAAAVPIALAAMGELLAERAGVLNLGVEGMMLVGAVVAFHVAGAWGLWLGFAAGGVAAMAFSSIHGFTSVTLRTNQIVSGLALTIFGIGLSTFIGKPLEGEPLAVDFTAVAWGPLAELPLLGPVLFNQDPIVHLTILLALIIHLYLFKTRLGLALRSVGESPATADSVGIKVSLFRYIHVMLGGLLAGLAGAYLILGQVPSWAQEATTSGLGWIALGLVVFGSWRPLRVLFGAFLFGLARRGNFWLQGHQIEVPAEFLAMLPYVLTIFVLVLWGTRDLQRRLGAPAALGIPYVREQR